jgi:hypothetical protein
MSTDGLDDSYWYDQWQHPAGDIVYMPCSNREAYQRAGFTLLQEKAYDIRNQMAADGAAARGQGLRSDNGSPTGPTAPFPAA